MLRYAAAAVLVACCGMMGLVKALSLRTRTSAIADIATGLGLLQSQITERRAPMPEIAAELAGSAPGKAGELFALIAEGMSELGSRSFCEIWDGAVSSLRLGKAESEALARLGPVLGRYDSEGQSREIELCRDRLSLLEREASQEAKTGARLYAGLGLTLGIMAAVVLI